MEANEQSDASGRQLPSADLLERLVRHRTLSAVPRAELEWLVRHGELRHIAVGEAISSKAIGNVQGLFVILSGQIAVYVDRGSGPQRVIAWRGGDVTGLLPYSRTKIPPGPSLAEEPTELFFMPGACLQEMTRECHELTTVLVHVMLDRVREFSSNEWQNERMMSLGKLAAGLAHELNNPASATARSAKLLDAHLDGVEMTSRELGAARLGEAQLAAIEALRTAATAPLSRIRSPIEAARHEDAIFAWLDDHGAQGSAAEALAETALTIEELEQLSASIDAQHLDVALRWVAEGSAVHRLSREIEQAAVQISKLVDAVKSFTRMDHAAVAESVDLGDGLRQTLAVLTSKARSKSVGVSVNVQPDLPRVRGFSGELNQIWANLIDNALDAVADSGRIDVTALCEHGSVVVRVIDDGPGIPTGMHERIFDPFFTTKPVGSGTGLGLDIVRRLVRHNDGIIKLASEPGRTEFQVTLPLVDVRGDGLRR